MVNFIKSQPAPTSLAIEKIKKKGRYNEQDVLKRIKKDFHNKCYVCEQKKPSSINVEHFKAHRGDIDLKFDWNNLFFACRYCNKIKGAKSIFDNILDCTNESHDVMNWISYKMKNFPYEPVLIEAQTDGVLISNTVELLNQVYRGTTPQSEMEAENLRDLIFQEVARFRQSLIHYYDDTTDIEVKELAFDNIKRSLKVQASFTAFKYWIIKENTKLSQDFQDLLPT